MKKHAGGFLSACFRRGPYQFYLSSADEIFVTGHHVTSRKAEDCRLSLWSEQRGRGFGEYLSYAFSTQELSLNAL